MNNPQGSNIIERVVNSLYYGLILIQKDIAIKTSKICGFIILALMTFSILKIILQNIGNVDIYSILKMIIPIFVKNIIIASLFVTPVSYKMNLGAAVSLPFKGKITGTVFTAAMEMLLAMVYKLGLIFFNDSRFYNITPGEIANIFFSRPLGILKEILGVMAFFSIFEVIGKIVMLILCLWMCGKIISIYITSIFMAPMLITFAIFYLMFYLNEETAEIGQKGLRIVIVQLITMFLSVAMLGLSYQVMNLIVTDSSMGGIVALTVIIVMLAQLMENISPMASGLALGGGVGQHKGDAFMSLGTSIGMIFAGAKIMAEAKLDELKEEKGDGEELIKTGNGKEDKKKELKNRMDEKSKQNVGYKKEDYNGKNNNEYYQKLENGGIIRYKKGRGIPKNAKKAKDSFRDYKNLKKRGGTLGNIGTAIFIGMSGDLSKEALLKELANRLQGKTEKGETISTNEQKYKEGIWLLKDGWKELEKQLTAPPVLYSEMGSMNETAKSNAYYNDNGKISEQNLNTEVKKNRYNNMNAYNVNNLINNLENVNRNNPNVITAQYTNPETISDMVGEAIKTYNNNTQIREKRRYKVDNGLEETEIEEE
jgi:membrane protein